MSLGLIDLEVLQQSGTEEEKKQAGKRFLCRGTVELVVLEMFLLRSWQSLLSSPSLDPPPDHVIAVLLLTTELDM
jgi:hypothetical protein